MLGLVAGMLTVLYAMNFSAIQVIPGSRAVGIFWVYPLFVALVFLVYLVGVRLTWAAGRRAALVVIALGVAFRLFMLPTQVVLSTDLYRYFWDGRVQLSGINPYRYPPEAQVLAELRDARIYPRINRAWAPTIYPPGAQILFAALEMAAPDRIWALRAVLIACELTTMLLLVVLLRRLGLPEGRVAVHAWAPLPIFEFAQAGHIDAALIPLVLGALLAAGRGRTGVAGGLLGGASLIKLYPAILLPVLWRRGDGRLPLAFLATAILGYFPYVWGVGWRVVGFLPTYFARFEEFNVGLRALLTDGVGITGTPARIVVSGFLAMLLVAVLVALGLIRGETPLDLASACGVAVGAFLLLVPSTIHPWYVVWLIPFLVVLPGPGWWYLTVAVALSYVAYAGGPVRVPGWVRAVEYLPAYLGVLLAFCRAWWRPAQASP
ncbi:MAG TPA: glycosyltransferase 87 family protein [Candidatus Methylomirabilis sp.]|nr:glycosyltransferase 87 family protein [Candidatus Methylomirabilis sp.]